MIKHRVTTTVAAAALLAFASTSAFAATEAEIGEALKSLFASGDEPATLELGAASVDGDAVVYSGNVLKSTGESGPQEAKIATITVTGGDVNAEGGLIAESLLAEGIDASDATDKMTIASIEVTGLEATPKAEGREGSGRFDTITAEGLAGQSQGQPPFSVESISVEAADYVGEYPRSVSANVTGIEADVAAMGESDPTAMQLKALGYDKLIMGVSFAGTWDEAAGTMTLEDLSIDGQDIGTVSLTGVFGGFTPEVLKQLAESDQPPPELMQQVTVNEATLSFSDASITGKLLDMQASQMGADRAAFVEQITAALPLMLSAVGNPAFQNKIAAAATAFLKDPQNITVSIAPDQPVDLMTLMMTGQTAPQTLPDVLKADVTANEAEAPE
jgi:hypothetical protein